MIRKIQWSYSESLRRKKAAGFTLMEVLVTVVILSIGLLGVASLQFSSLKGNQSAFHMAIASALAAEGADRVRANLPGVRDPGTGLDRHAYDLINSAGNDPECIDSGCTYGQLAQHDAYEWIKKIESLLPSGQGTICRDATPYDGVSSAVPECDGKPDANGTNIFAIKVWWDHDHNPRTSMSAYRMSIVP